MPTPLRVARCQDYYVAANATASTTAATVAFTPPDFPALAAPSGWVAVMVAEECWISNLDATNTIYVRPITLTSTGVQISTNYPAEGLSSSQFSMPSGVQNELLWLKSSTVNAATSSDIAIPPGARNVPIYARCVGFSVLSSAATPAYQIAAFGQPAINK